MSKHDSTLWYLLERLSVIADTYTDLKNDEYERDINTRLGRWAIKYNIIFFIFFGGGTALGIFAATMFNASSVLYGILLVVAALGMVITSIVFVILAFACEISQMKLNKKPIGLIALLSTFAIILAAVVAIIITVVLSL